MSLGCPWVLSRGLGSDSLNTALTAAPCLALLDTPTRAQSLTWCAMPLALILLPWSSKKAGQMLSGPRKWRLLTPSHHGAGHSFCLCIPLHVVVTHHEGYTFLTHNQPRQGARCSGANACSASTVYWFTHLSTICLIVSHNSAVAHCCRQAHALHAMLQ